MPSLEMNPYSKIGSPAEKHLLPRANVLGVGVHAVNMESALQLIKDSVANRERGYICLAGVHGVMEARRDATFMKILTQASLVLPDGMPTVWMGRLQGFAGMNRVFGPDLMLAIMSHPDFASCSHFLYGGAPGVAGDLYERLTRRLPRLRIVGYYTPPFRRLNCHEDLELANKLQDSKPDIMWIGLGTPKQEHFMAEYLPRLNTRLMVGVGAAFDFHTGRLKDSPQWVKPLGLQWLHRLVQEPSRLWKRYARNNPPFLVNACLQLAGMRRYTLVAIDNRHETPLRSTSIRAICE